MLQDIQPGAVENGARAGAGADADDETRTDLLNLKIERNQKNLIGRQRGRHARQLL